MATRSWTADVGYLEKRAALKADIQSLIEPFKRSTDRPTFTATEMVCMAITCHADYGVSPADILEWILSNFAFYGQRAIVKYAQAAKGNMGHFEALRDGDESVVEDFYLVFGKYLSPVSVLEWGGRWHDSPGLVTADPRASRLALRKHLQPIGETAFRFLELASELRNSIYELVLCLPESGIRVDHCDGQLPELSVIKDILRESDAASSWVNGSDPRPTELQFLETGLALRSTCKQIEKEVTALFYATNTFYITSLSGLDALARRGPAVAFNSLTRLALDVRNPFEWRSMSAALGAHKPLKWLAITVEDATFLSTYSYDVKSVFSRKHKFAKVSQIPGFSDLALAVSKAEKFELYGNCPKIREFLDTEVAKIKAGQQITKGRKPRQTKTKAADKTGGKKKA